MYLDQILCPFTGPETVLGRRWNPDLWSSLPHRSDGIAIPLRRQLVPYGGVGRKHDPG